MANKVYINPETALAIDGTVGADYAWTVEGLADAAGRVSARIDLGVAPRADLYEWRCSAMWQATPTQGGTLDFYIATSDGTTVDGDVGTTDIALPDVDNRRNLQYIGSVTAEDAALTAMNASGVFYCRSRYLSMVAYNDGGAAINATDSNFVFTITPIPAEVQ